MPFSHQTVTAITAVVTGGPGFSSQEQRVGVYRTGPQLEMFFGAVNLPLHIGASSRVPSVRSLLIATNDQPDGEEAIKRVVEAVVDPREYLSDPERRDAVVDYLNDRLRLDGFELRFSGNRHRLFSIATNNAATTALRDHAASLQLDSVLRDFDRALAQANSDPADAITAAC